MNTWGKEIIIDAYDCNHVNIRSYDMICNFSNYLVEQIKMKKYKEPQVFRFGEGNKIGYTLVQLIETSNITFHFIEETNSLCGNVFSCKDFDPKIVEDVVIKFFSPKIIETQVLLRGKNKMNISS